jgi:CheY-like chemotaxis protein
MPQPTLLIVDDEPSLQELFHVLFTRAGYRVTLATSADEAFTALSDQPFDGVLIDMHLDGRGLDVVEFIRVSDRDLPIAILTGGRLTPQEQEIARRHHANVFYKPHPLSGLLAHFGGVLHRP